MIEIRLVQENEKERAGIKMAAKDGRHGNRDYLRGNFYVGAGYGLGKSKGKGPRRY